MKTVTLKPIKKFDIREILIEGLASMIRQKIREGYNKEKQRKQ